ncbi:MAG: hypothetical protein PUK39_11325, partial [Clostridiales bacterium]|nr:hypothetical protein [Clostridiales bacterium]
PDSGPFHAALHHFSLKYVSIPAKKCLAQRKNFSLPVTLGVFRYTLEHLQSIEGAGRICWSAPFCGVFFFARRG